MAPRANMPPRSRPSSLGTRTRTTTVLVVGSTSGAMASTAPATLPTPSTSSSARWPTLTSPTRAADTGARRSSTRVSATSMTGVPLPSTGCPAGTRMAATTPAIGARKVARSSCTPAMPPVACADLSAALGGDDGGARVVDLLLGGDAVAKEPLGALELGARVLQVGDGVLALRRRLRHVLLERLGLDVRQRLPDLDRVALGDEDAIDAPGHERADLDVAARQRRQHAGDGDARRTRASATAATLHRRLARRLLRRRAGSAPASARERDARR